MHLVNCFKNISKEHRKYLCGAVQAMDKGRTTGQALWTATVIFLQVTQD
jgi:hypothetical protein